MDITEIIINIVIDRTRKLNAEGQRLVSEGVNLLKPPNFLYGVGVGEGGGGVQDQLLMLNPNSLYSGSWDGGWGPTFDAQSKSAKKLKILISYMGGGGGGVGGGGGYWTNF